MLLWEIELLLSIPRQNSIRGQDEYAMEISKNVWRLFLMLLGISLFAPSSLRAVTVDWDRNSETNIGGYRIYWGPASRAYTSVLDLANTNSVQLPTPSAKTFYAVTAYTMDGLESEYSDEVLYTPPNQAPSVLPDSYATSKNQTLNVAQASGVLANDSDPDGDTLTAILITDPTHGTLNLSGNGSFTYVPATGYTGSDIFTYRVTDGSSTSALASVALTISPAANQAPLTVNDAYSGWRNQTLHINATNGVLSNDSDPDGDFLSVFLVSAPASGALTLQFDGTFTFKPASNFTGVAQFTYRATDGALNSSVTTVSLIINPPPNQTPVANSDNFSLLKNKTLTVNAPGVLGNDSDADAEPLHAVLVSGPNNGTLTLRPDGGFTFRPASNFVGTTEFSYSAADARSTSAVATVQLLVNAPPVPTNGIPIGVPDTYTTMQNSRFDVGVEWGVLTNDIATEGATLSAMLINAPANGTLLLEPNGAFSYEPESNFVGSVEFTYSVTDGTNTSDAVPVTISVSEPTCELCVAGVEMTLASREQYLATISSLKEASANRTCLNLTLTIFKTLAKTADVSGDPVLQNALDDLRERIALVLEHELKARLLKVKELPESRWRSAATNKLESARKVLATMSELSSFVPAAKSFSTTAVLLSTADRSLLTAETAPGSLVEQTFSWRRSRTEKWVIKFTANEFVIQTEAGEPVTQGPYTYARTAWNAGILWIVPSDSLPNAPALEIAQANLKFSRISCRADGPLKGTWRRSN